MPDDRQPPTSALRAPALRPGDAGFTIVGSQVGAAATALGLDPAPLLGAMAMLGSSLRKRARVTLTGEIDRLGVLTGIPGDPTDASLLRELVATKGAPAELIEAFAARGTPSVEVWGRTNSSDVDVWLHAEGDASTTDLTLAGISGDAGRTMAHLLRKTHGVSRQLGGRGALVHARLSADDAATSIPALLAAQQIVPAQRQVVAGLHPVLAKGRDVVISLRAAATGVIREVRLGYANVAWDTAVRILVPIRQGHDVGRALGQLAGATGAADVARFTLVLRDKDPFQAIVAVDLTPSGDHVS